LIASIGGATARRLNASHAHDKCPWPMHITTSGKITMKSWRIPTYFWKETEKGIHHYAEHLLKRDKEEMPPEPQKPFGQHSIPRATYYK
jgi:hypothetical protein